MFPSAYDYVIELLCFHFFLSLLEVLPDHLNAEIVAGTITSKQDAMDYLTWTYFFRRLLINPSYYDLEDIDNDSVNKFLSALVEGAVREVENSACVEIGEVNLLFCRVSDEQVKLKLSQLTNRTEGSLCHGLLGRRSWTAGASNRPQVTQSRLLDEVHLLFTFTMFIPKLIFRFISMLI